MRALLAKTLFSAALALLASAGSAHAADPVGKPAVYGQLPAIDGLNGKISAFGGWNDPGRPGPDPIPGLNRNAGLFGGSGSLSVPLGHSFGLQIDAAAAAIRGTSVLASGAHLFWRDPSRGLIGVYGSGSHLNIGGGLNSYRVALEAEAYLGRFTLSALAGVEGGNSFNFTGGQIGTRTRFVDDVRLSYYVNDNWRVTVGHTYTSARHAAILNTEYLFSLGNGRAASVFAEARIGERGNRAAISGVTIYFGQKDKTLIRRQREDDPPNYTQLPLSSFGFQGNYTQFGPSL